MSAISQHWKEAIDKEEHLRLRWYVHNEEKIQQSANKQIIGVSDQQTSALVDYQAHMVNNKERKFRQKGKEEPIHAPEDEDTPVTQDQEKYVTTSQIMQPVLLEVNNMIYNTGRVPYLKKRSELLPEKRYYYKETTGFEYGWKMWDCAKTMEMKRYGKSAIIKQTFYRRRAGIEQDPSWYRAPVRNSPTVCNAI